MLIEKEKVVEVNENNYKEYNITENEYYRYKLYHKDNPIIIEYDKIFYNKACVIKAMQDKNGVVINYVESGEYKSDYYENDKDKGIKYRIKEK